MRFDLKKSFALFFHVFCVGIFSASVSAQVLILPSEFTGNFDEDEQASFTVALQTAIETHLSSTEVLGESETITLLGDSAPTFPLPADLDISYSAVVHASISGEDDIYDFIVQIHDPEGNTLSEQFGDCIICPSAGALEAFSETIALVCNGLVIESEDEVAEVIDPEPAAPAFEAGDILLRIRSTPETAEISVNGEVVGIGSASVEVAPQDLILTISAPNHETATEELTVNAQMTGPVLMRFSLSEEAAPRRNRSGNSALSGSVQTSLLVGGLVAIIGGSVLLALDGKSTCSDGAFNDCPDVYETTLGGTSLVALGGLAFGVGFGNLLFGSNTDNQVAFRIDRNQAFFSVRHRF